MADNIRVEVVYAFPGAQALVELSLHDGATVADAIAKSGLQQRFANAAIESLPAGIWGHLVDRDQRLKNGDRVEIYRPLLRDPRDARRELAQSGLTMGALPDD